MKGKLRYLHAPASLGKAVAAVTFATHSMFSFAALTIEQAQMMAVSSDAGIAQFIDNSNAARSESVAKGQLPDPILTIGTQSLPTDTLSFDQEPMTQFKLGVRQQFPQGDTLSLRESKLVTQSLSLEEKAQTRYLKISRQVRTLWLEIKYWEQAIQIFTEDESLFLQLLEVTRSLYSVGTVQQQDVLRAELELSRLKENIIKATRQNQAQRALLSRWIGGAATVESWPTDFPVIDIPQPGSKNLLAYASDKQVADSGRAKRTQQMIATLLQSHPMLLDLEKQVEVADHDIRLSEEEYKPTWGVELNYGYRDGENNDGSDRADLFGAMVNLSLPLFTASRQDKSVQSAAYRKDAQKNTHQDALRRMVGEVQKLLRLIRQNEEQLTLFDDQILSQASLQAEASLNAYQADASDFAEVMRSYISEQRDRLDYARLQTTRLQLISDLQFYFPESTVDLSGYEQSKAYLIQSDLMSLQGDSK